MSDISTIKTQLEECKQLLDMYNNLNIKSIEMEIKISRILAYIQQQEILIANHKDLTETLSELEG